ncbi:MAG: hypothetical protein ABI678_21380 [Kofleriaceae bacterium]
MSESAIHDLGYKRYVGTRRPPSTRWRVIMRHQIAAGWKTFWRYKAWLGAAVIVTVIAALFIFLGSDTRFGRRIQTTFSDMALPFAFDWYGRIAFIITLRLVATVIATDVQSGAFTFYFARSTRTFDYLLGKLAGCATLIGGIVIGGSFLVTLMRLGMAGAESVSDLVPRLWLLPKTLAIATLMTLAYSAIPLAFSALVANRRAALATWAAWYLLVGAIANGLGFAFHLPLGAIDVATSIHAVTFHLLDEPFSLLGPSSANLPSLTIAVVSLVAQIGIALAIVYVALRRAQHAGVGGSS